MENVLSFSLNFPTDCANSGTIAPFLIPLCCAFPFIILSLNLFVQSNLSNNRCHKQNLLTCSSRSPWQHSGVPKSLLHLRTSITLPTTTQSINVQKLTTLLFMDDSLFQILQNFSLRHWQKWQPAILTGFYFQVSNLLKNSSVPDSFVSYNLCWKINQGFHDFSVLMVLV